MGRKDLLDEAKNVPPIRDFVIPPSDPIAPYFSEVLKQKFGFGSAYLVFRNAEPVAAFKANTRDKIIDVTDYEGSEKDGELSKNLHGSIKCLENRTKNRWKANEVIAILKIFQQTQTIFNGSFLC